MTENTEMLIDLLTAKKAAEGYTSIKELLAQSTATQDVYPYTGHFLAMRESTNSRALFLVVVDTKWESAYQLDENVDAILAHIVDFKPITARQFVEVFPSMAAKRETASAFTGNRRDSEPRTEKDNAGTDEIRECDRTVESQRFYEIGRLGEYAKSTGQRSHFIGTDLCII